MPQAINVVFDFNGAPTTTRTGLHTISQIARTSLINVTGTQTVPYSESGINFTLSTVGGDGSNTSYLQWVRAITVSFGGLHSNDILLFNNDTGASDVFVFDVVNGGDVSFGTVTIEASAATGWTMNGVALVNGANTITGQFPDLRFTHSSAHQSLRIQKISGTINCFTAGTRIATPNGARDVETLRPGDRIPTADGGATTVKWLGRQDIDTRLADPRKVNPARITAGALGNSLPARDLSVSPDHAIGIEGYLINASALVNGHSIHQVRDMPRDGFTYYHVETEAHELILAEGCAAESYLDAPDRSAFDNGAERAGAAPIREMDLPRIATARLVPAPLVARLAGARAA